MVSFILFPLNLLLILRCFDPIDLYNEGAIEASRIDGLTLCVQYNCANCSPLPASDVLLFLLLLPKSDAFYYHCHSLSFEALTTS